MDCAGELGAGWTGGGTNPEGGTADLRNGAEVPRTFGYLEVVV